MKRFLKWMWLSLFPPAPPCPRCERPALRMNRVDGHRTYRCLHCLIKFDRAGNRYLWRDK